MTGWIDKRVPVIQQTGRWGKDGFVTWALFHEIGHVLNDPRGEMHLEYKTEKMRSSAAEKGANQFAFETLFGEDGIEPFRGLTRDGDIVRAARKAGISPGVAVHQMHRKRLLDYKFGNDLCVDSKALLQRNHRRDVGLSQITQDCGRCFRHANANDRVMCRTSIAQSDR